MMGLLGAKVDAIDYYSALINKLNEQVSSWLKGLFQCHFC
jgi:hypothetical protein